jgi:hypothetical protein
MPEKNTIAEFKTVRVSPEVHRRLTELLEETQSKYPTGVSWSTSAIIEKLLDAHDLDLERSTDLAADVG